MIKFNKMSKTDYTLYSNEGIKKIAKEYVLSGYCTEEESLQISKTVFSNYLPDGVDTKDNYIFNIINDKNEKVGIIWFGKVKNDEVFIYDFSINTNFQRQGYGKQSMINLEKFVKSLGINKISLHIFGHNKAALALFEKMGYNAFSIDMFKSI